MRSFIASYNLLRVMVTKAITLTYISILAKQPNLELTWIIVARKSIELENFKVWTFKPNSLNHNSLVTSYPIIRFKSILAATLHNGKLVSIKYAKC